MGALLTRAINSLFSSVSNFPYTILSMRPPLFLRFAVLSPSDSTNPISHSATLGARNSITALGAIESNGFHMSLHFHHPPFLERAQKPTTRNTIETYIYQMQTTPKKAQMSTTRSNRPALFCTIFYTFS